MVRLTKQDKKEISKRYNFCYRKRRYSSKEEAEGVVFKMKYKHGKPNLTSYQCTFCGGFHTGNL